MVETADKPRDNTEKVVKNTDTRIDVLVSKMVGRRSELLVRRQALLTELIPMDAAIHELTQMLVAAGVKVEAVGERVELLDRNVMQTSPPVEFSPITQTTVVRNPVVIERRGPGETPLAVDTGLNTAVRQRMDVAKPLEETVVSPKSGTPIQTNVATLRRAVSSKVKLI